MPAVFTHQRRVISPAPRFARFAEVIRGADPVTPGVEEFLENLPRSRSLRGDGDGEPLRLAAAELYLLLWGRWPCADARYQVTGDRSLMEHWQRHAVIT